MMVNRELARMSKYCFSSSLEILREIMKPLGQHILYSGRASSRTGLEYKSEEYIYISANLVGRGALVN